MPNILLIEDEETLAKAMQFALGREGLAVRIAPDGIKGLAMARDIHPDVVLLDLMLPGMDGLEVCRRLRAESAVPVIMLTAKADEVDKIVGLELGADDYVTKPFSTRELIARVRAQLRRAELSKAEPAVEKDQGRFAVDGLEVDVPRRTVKRNGEAVQLRPKEFDLLAFFLRGPGIVFSRETLLERVWGFDYAGDTRTVDVHIRWLREKVEENPAEPRRLVTVRGIGYKLEA